MAASPSFNENELAMCYYYGFTSSQLVEDFREKTQDVIKTNITSLEEIINLKFPGQQEAIKEQTTNLLRLFLEIAETPLRQFEIKSREIFALPQNASAFTEVNIEPVESGEIEKLEKEVSELMKEYREEACYKSYLEKQIERYEQVEPLRQEIDEILKFHEKNKVKPGEKTIKELHNAMKTLELQVYEKQLIK
ncbi:uncharacterized protein LOC100142240 [Tribolium castaneum]|uniref:Protein MIS12 homolog n=1 Tax=Tribolium castaneum TaxID=7070 RepID=D7EHY9_TRICA|nr:PREDICTED: uncharacterized protein LOC100142240 [Tribolium castaneum]EFA12689.1 hypothetical protein TcasGA2_TC001997 [Tribolium castaneum]|eukprot:XP_001808363.1 PREDICTED: uncharacterized protein LOC100142240 [Tribolium castaneum]